MKIYEVADIEPILRKKNLIDRYKKAKKYLEDGYLQSVFLKKRNPKGSGIWQFRINKQYRAFGFFKTSEIFVVFEIYDHQ